MHFDSSLDLLLACDASAYGLGTVLSHKMADGSERPTALSRMSCLRLNKGTPKLKKKHWPVFLVLNIPPISVWQEI